jgi:hypothetical protein
MDRSSEAEDRFLFRLIYNDPTQRIASVGEDKDTVYFTGLFVIALLKQLQLVDFFLFIFRDGRSRFQSVSKPRLSTELASHVSPIEF